ncbi:MAG: BspA family leucine-rich repeat surface protein, partial [Clostridia bacterium]|nr:BspA family leucine-rich repeat surface protein [Clostridia bacterium]
FQKAKLAKGQYETASVQEQLELELAAMQMEEQDNLTIAEYIEHLKSKNIINNDNVYKRIFNQNGEIEEISEAALKINGEIFVVYIEGTNIKVCYEEGNVMASDVDSAETDNWLNLKYEENGEDVFILRNQIKSIRFVNTDIEPLSEPFYNVAAQGREQNSVACCWTKIDGLYDIIIGAKGGVTAPKNCRSLFAKMNNLETLVFNNNFYTKNTNNMFEMFNLSSKLSLLNLDSNFNTSEVVDMGAMFHEMTALKNINFSQSFDTSNVKSMWYMFRRCTSLESLDFRTCNFDTKNVESMCRMFGTCSSLGKINGETNNYEIFNLGEKFDTRNVLNMSGMFGDCKSLTSLNLSTSNFDTRKVESMSQMFGWMNALETLNLGTKFDTSEVQEMSWMFYDCWSIKEIDLSGCNFDTKNVKGMFRMFEGCKVLKTLKLGDFGVGNEGIEGFSLANNSFFSGTPIGNIDLTISEDAYDWFFNDLARGYYNASNFKTVNGEIVN